MRSRCSRALTMLALLVMQATVGYSQRGAVSWLDEPGAASWNTPGRVVPAAPDVPDPVNPRCRELARPPQTEEDKSVRDRGWDLVGAFQGGWNVLVVRGTASYDGMCRPMQYQDFVFVRGIFAGTLAPQPMDSRTDGALSRVSIASPTRLTAEYLRYEPSDALCCPSRTTRVVFDIAQEPPVVRAASASTSPNADASGASGQAEQRPASGASAPAGLEGTSWQLVRFEGSDGAVLTPDDRAKYAIDFGADGQVAVRVDCNRGRGTWKSDGTRSIEFGPLALTRAMCPAGSLHDQIVRQWGSIRSYVIRDSHLFLALMADGGIYEFEPVIRPR